MSRKRTDEDRTVISRDLHDRIVELSKRLWQGNRSQMARDLKIDQPTISRVLAGEQRPSAKLLEKLATHQEVNVAWLFRGEGEPLLSTELRPGVGGYRPLLDELLPGPLNDHVGRLSGVSYPVAPAFESKTSYWYRVEPNTPVTKSQHNVNAGDLLLLETDQSWTRDGYAVAGKFCGIRQTKQKRTVLTLCWIDWNSKTTLFEPYWQYKVDTFEQLSDVWLIVPTQSDGEEEARRSVSGTLLHLEHIVCVCTRLERVFTKGHFRRQE